MNKTHTTINLFRELTVRLAAIFGRDLTNNGLRFLMIAALLIATTSGARAACQTPQFGLPVVLSVTRPVAAAAGDFDRNGTVDVAVLKSNSSTITVEIFSGNGTGGFASTGTQYTAFSANFGYDLVAADFNNDGRLDLAATGSANSEVAILLGNAAGAFNPAVAYNADDARAIAVGDFNNDGNADLISRGYDATLILPGQGNGTFGAAISVAMGGNGYTRGISVGNFNNDGFLDFASVLTNTDVAPIRLGSGNFIFSSPPPISLPSPSEATVNDFNRDGKPDVAAVNDSFNGSVSMHLGNGDGTFSTLSGSPFPTGGAYSQTIVSGDFNNDNIPDIAVGNESVSNSLSILLNNGTGVLGTGFNLSPGQNDTERLYAVDFNRNGATDLIVVKEITQNQVIVVPNVCPPATRNNFPDFDADGRADISVFRPSNGFWFINRSTQGNTQVQLGVASDKIVPADYDGDGRTDLAVYRADDGIWYVLNSTTNTVRALLYGFPTDVPVPGDYDGDGRVDFAVFRPTTGVWYLLQSTAGFRGVQFGQTGDKPVAADYDGDGKFDLAVNRSGTWFLNRSQLGFTGVAFGAADDKLVPADYDGDGKTDVAVFRPTGGIWYYQRSTLGFGGVQFGLSTDLPVPADYDGDGRTDVAVYRGGSWFLNRTTQGFTGIAFGAADDKPVPNAFVP